MTENFDTSPSASDTETPIWKTWAFAATLGVLFGLIEAAQLRFGSSALGRPVAFQLAVARVLPFWVLFACLIPLAVVVLRRFQKVSSVLRPTLPRLAATAIGFSLLVLGGRMLFPMLDQRSGPRAQSTPLQLFETYFVLDVLTYTALVGTLYAFHYYREARNRELMASLLEASLAEERLKGLAARVDPAFLFTTLGTVSQLARRGEHKAVVDTLDRLSELLRAALNDEPTEEVPLSVEIEALRAEWNHTVEYAAEPEVASALVPRGILSVLVEHAVLSSTSQDVAGARRIAIRASRSGNAALDVELHDARSWAIGTDTNRHADVDTALLHQRLRDLYGRAYRLDMTSAPDGGRISLRIPWRTALDGEARSSIAASA